MNDINARYNFFARSLKEIVSSFVPPFTVCGRVDKALVCLINDTVGHVVTDILLLAASSTKKQLAKKNTMKLNTTYCANQILT